jgi:hypothetical protein
MPVTYKLDPDSIPVASIEEFDEFRDSITLFTTPEGRQAWHYVPDEVFNDYTNYFFYFGFADDGPLGQPHNSFVRIYEADGPEYEIGSQEAEEAEGLSDLRGNPLNPGPQETALWETDVDALVLRGELPPMD